MQFYRFLRRTKITPVNGPAAVVIKGPRAGTQPEKPCIYTTGNGPGLWGYSSLFLGLKPELQDFVGEPTQDPEKNFHRI
jgi:hypothetical protein